MKKNSPIYLGQANIVRKCCLHLQQRLTTCLWEKIIRWLEYLNRTLTCILQNLLETANIFNISVYMIYEYILLAWVLCEQKQIPEKKPQRWLIPFKVLSTVVSAPDDTSGTSPDIWNLQTPTLADFCCKQGLTGRISKGIRQTLLVIIFYYFVLC